MNMTLQLEVAINTDKVENLSTQHMPLGSHFSSALIFRTRLSPILSPIPSSPGLLTWAYMWQCGHMAMFTLYKNGLSTRRKLSTVLRREIHFRQDLDLWCGFIRWSLRRMKCKKYAEIGKDRSWQLDSKGKEMKGGKGRWKGIDKIGWGPDEMWMTFFLPLFDSFESLSLKFLDLCWRVNLYSPTINHHHRINGRTGILWAEIGSISWSWRKSSSSP